MKDVYLMLLYGIIIFFIGLAWGVYRTDSHYKKETVKRGAAYYKPDTGEWSWTMPVQEK